MNERLIIKNFGPITDMDIVIKAFTVFIGPQGSGKSTAAKVLTICRDLSWYLQILDRDINVKEPFKKFCIDEYFKDNTYIKYLSVFEKAKYEFAVYNLNPSADKYCKNLKNPKTGLIGVNELDLVSEFIGEDYDRLYQIIAYSLPMKPMALNFILKGW